MSIESITIIVYISVVFFLELIGVTIYKIKNDGNTSGFFVKYKPHIGILFWPIVLPLDIISDIIFTIHKRSKRNENKIQRNKLQNNYNSKNIHSGERKTRPNKITI